MQGVEEVEVEVESKDIDGRLKLRLTLLIGLFEDGGVEIDRRGTVHGFGHLSCTMPAELMGGCMLVVWSIQFVQLM